MQNMPILAPEMPQSLPRYALKTRESEGGTQVWDAIRRQWLVLTHEEQVRQSLIQFLTATCGVPKGLISLEKGLHYDRRRKRYDLLVYDRAGRPFILCECKEPRVPIDDAVVQQISVYNHKIGARILILTNGHQLLAFAQTQPGKWTGLALPDPDLPGGEAWFGEAERLLP
jgi:hypothetical protein